MEQAIPVVNGFQHSDRKYMCETCCCGAVHCRTGAKRVGIFMTVMMTLEIFIYILTFIFTYSVNSTSVFFLYIRVAITYLLFMGIREMNPRLILPYAAFTFLGVFISIVGMLFSVKIMIYPSSYLSENYIRRQDIMDLRRMSSIALFFCSLSLIINYWFFNIIKRCYTYLLDFEDYRKVHGSVAVDVQGLV